MTAPPPADNDLVQLIAAGDFAAAEAHCRRAMEAGENPRAVYLLGVIKAQQGRPNEAIPFLEWASERLPDDADVAYNFGVVCQNAGRIERAIEEWRRAVRLRPGYPQARYNLAKALADTGHRQDAIIAYRQLIGERPEHVDGRFNLANLLLQSDDFAAAEREYRAMLERRPDHVEGWVNLGLARKKTGDLAGAERAYRQAVALDRDAAGAHWNLSDVLLRQGRWAEGFAEFEWRLKLASMRPPAWSAAPWRGEHVAGKRIVLYAEQGVGDAIQFLRYAERVAARGAEVTVCCHPALVSLAAGAPGVAAALPFGAEMPPFDLFAPLMSLPHLLGETDPAAGWRGPYLHARAKPPVEFAGDGLRVGIAWSGNTADARNRERAVPLIQFAPLARIPGATCFSLQVGTAARALADVDFAERVIDLAPYLTDYASTAAAIAQVDAVVTVCTSVAHLAGAMGRPTFVLLARLPDWRWGDKGETTPWYPTMRLLRQRAAGHWEEPIADAVAAVRQMLNRPGR